MAVQGARRPARSAPPAGASSRKGPQRLVRRFLTQSTMTPIERYLRSSTQGSAVAGRCPRETPNRTSFESTVTSADAHDLQKDAACGYDDCVVDVHSGYDEYHQESNRVSPFSVSPPRPSFHAVVDASASTSVEASGGVGDDQGASAAQDEAISWMVQPWDVDSCSTDGSYMSDKFLLLDDAPSTPSTWRYHDIGSGREQIISVESGGVGLTVKDGRGCSAGGYKVNGKHHDVDPAASAVNGPVNAATAQVITLKRRNNGRRRNRRNVSSSSNASGVTIIKGQWTPEEDSILVRLMNEHGVNRRSNEHGATKWSLIAKMLGGRIGKQCRERWHNHLRPDIKKDSWSEEEERLLVEAHEQLGNRWAEIAKRIPGRTENSIKNHWNATVRKQQSSKGNNKSSRDSSTSSSKIVTAAVSCKHKRSSSHRPSATSSSRKMAGSNAKLQEEQQRQQQSVSTILLDYIRSKTASGSSISTTGTVETDHPVPLSASQKLPADLLPSLHHSSPQILFEPATSITSYNPFELNAMVDGNYDGNSAMVKSAATTREISTTTHDQDPAFRSIFANHYYGNMGYDHLYSGCHYDSQMSTPFIAMSEAIDPTQDLSSYTTDDTLSYHYNNLDGGPAYSDDTYTSGGSGILPAVEDSLLLHTAAYDIGGGAAMLPMFHEELKPKPQQCISVCTFASSQPAVPKCHHKIGLDMDLVEMMSMF